MTAWLWKTLRERRLAQTLLVCVCLAWPARLGWEWLRRPGPARLLQQALRLADGGDRPAAAALLDELLRRNPEHSYALLLRGQLARESGDRVAAGRFWRRVPDRPSSLAAKARFLEGTLLLEVHRAHDAEAAFSKATELDPAMTEPHEALFRLYAVQLRAADIRRESLAIRRSRRWRLSEVYQLVNATGEAVNREEAIPQLEQFTAADPDDILSHVALGRYYLLDDRPAEAVAVLRCALERRRDDPSIRGFLAEALLKQSDLAGARDVLRGTPARRDSPQPLWRSYGLCLAADGQWRAASACLRRAVAMHPDDRPTVVQLACALERAGNAGEAARVWDRAQRLVQLKAALFRFVQAPENRPDVSLSALMVAGETLMQLGRLDEAVAFFEQVLASDSRWPDAARKHEEALRLQRRALAEQDSAGPEEFLESAIATVAELFDDGPMARRVVSEVDTQAPLIRFADRHRESGVDFQYANGAAGGKYLLETTGGGVAVLDYDGDGWPDLFFPQGGSLPLAPADAADADGLYRNSGDGTFCEVAPAAGLNDNQYSQGCAAGDFDNDGFTDLAIANCGTNVLYRNNGDGTFTDVTAASGIGGKHWSTSLGWGDLNGDGNLDLYVVNYVTHHLQPCRNRAGANSVCHPQIFDAEPDALYVSRGDGTFEEGLQQAGMASPHGRGLGLLIADFNDDGWQDVYVANDANPSFLFENLGPHPNGIPRFAEVGFPSGTAVNSAGNATAAMGIACADLDGDGRLDLYVTNFHHEADLLFLNRGGLLFEDAAQRAGLVDSTKPMLGWGTQAIDVDLDGKPEIFLTNGHLDDRRSEGVPWKMPPQLLYNLGAGRFCDISRACGEFFRGEYLGRGVARLDWNRDGRPDLVVVHQDRPVALLQNETESTGHFLVVELHGVRGNRDAIGARLRVTAGGSTQVVEVCGGDGYCATNDRRQVIGLASAENVSDLVVTWPGGREVRWTNLPGDVMVTLIEGQPLHFLAVGRSHP
jgi:tetratricopeptide (TPR) repeat protein